jgi:hypothetical protein
MMRTTENRSANVSAKARPDGETPLHSACFSGNVTNLDFVELLFENGADPNSQDLLGQPPLSLTYPHAPGAAKFLLNWPATDANITDRSGDSFPAKVRGAIEYFFNKVALTDNPEQVQHQFLLQQWREIEKMLVERGATDTNITHSN